MSPEKYNEISNYLTNASYPEGIVENMKRSIRKNAKRSKICSGKLFYYWNQVDKPSIVIQESQVQSVLKEIHDDSGHQCYRYVLTKTVPLQNLSGGTVFDKYPWSMSKTVPPTKYAPLISID